jgi:hypothetical protein
MLVSAIGASARSAIFYLRVKGETEEALAALGYPALHIFRPGLLLGQRAESRPREALGMALAPFLNPLMLGPAKAYRSIPADAVAAAMIAAAGRAHRPAHPHLCRHDGTRGDRSLDRIEIGDQWSQLRMLDAELLTADGNDLPVSRISEESSQQMPSDKSGCTGEEGGAMIRAS